MTFRAVVELGGRTATGLAIPDAVIEALGAGKRPLATSHRREHVRSVTDAKAAPTRERRIRKVVAALGGS